MLQESGYVWVLIGNRDTFMTLYIPYRQNYLWSAGVQSEFVSSDEVLDEKYFGKNSNGTNFTSIY